MKMRHIAQGAPLKLSDHCRPIAQYTLMALTLFLMSCGGTRVDDMSATANKRIRPESSSRCSSSSTTSTSGSTSSSSSSSSTSSSTSGTPIYVPDLCVSDVPARPLSKPQKVFDGRIDSKGFNAGITQKNELVIWGDVGYAPLPNDLPDNIRSLAVGGNHVVLLAEDGSVSKLKVLNSARESFEWQWQPTDLTHVTAIAAGGSHSLALLEDGSVRCWDAFTPKPGADYQECDMPADLANVQAISVAGVQNLALLKNGTLKTWGHHAGLPKEPLEHITAIAISSHCNMALDDEGVLYSWGNYPAPANITSEYGAVAIAGGYDHCLVLLDDGSLVGWGGEYFGELDFPKDIGEITDLVAGRGFTMIRTADGQLKSWGKGANWEQNFNPSVPSEYSGIEKISNTQFIQSVSNLLTLSTNGELIDFKSRERRTLEWPSEEIKHVISSASLYAVLANDGRANFWSRGLTHVDVNDELVGSLTSVSAIQFLDYQRAVVLDNNGFLDFWGTWDAANILEVSGPYRAIDEYKVVGKEFYQDGYMKYEGVDTETPGGLQKLTLSQLISESVFDSMGLLSNGQIAVWQNTGKWAGVFLPPIVESRWQPAFKGVEDIVEARYFSKDDNGKSTAIYALTRDGRVFKQAVSFVNVSYQDSRNGEQPLVFYSFQLGDVEPVFGGLGSIDDMEIFGDARVFLKKSGELVVWGNDFSLPEKMYEL